MLIGRGQLFFFFFFLKRLQVEPGVRLFYRAKYLRKENGESDAIP